MVGADDGGDGAPVRSPWLELRCEAERGFLVVTDNETGPGSVAPPMIPDRRPSRLGWSDNLLAVRNALHPRMRAGWEIEGFRPDHHYVLSPRLHPSCRLYPSEPITERITVKLISMTPHRLRMPLVSPFTKPFSTQLERLALLIEVQVDVDGVLVTGWGENVAMNDPLHCAEYVEGCAEVIRRRGRS